MKMPPSFRARRITPPAAPKAITVNRKPQKAAHGLVDKHTGVGECECCARQPPGAGEVRYVVRGRLSAGSLVLVA